MSAQVAENPIPFNPTVFQWARERLRIAVDDAAKRAGVTAERIRDWERGEDSPTVRQARKLANLYDRPFLEFLMPEVPKLREPEMVPDYRFLRGEPSDLEKVVLRGIQEWAEEQRQNALDLYDELGEAPPRLPKEISANITDSPERAAEAVRKFLDFPVEIQFALKSKGRSRLPSILRGVIESCGVLVLKQSGLLKARARGICLYADVLPIIIFGNEASGGQAFTLAHEFGHVVLGESAISGAPRLGYERGSPSKRIEGWCNSFAAAFLMPAADVRGHDTSPAQKVEWISDDNLKKLAGSFAVSEHAMLIRLVSLGLVDASFYWRTKRADFLAREGNFKAGGRSEYYGTRYRSSLGDHYTGLVLEALSTGRIGHHNAAEFMGIKNVRHLLDIQENFRR